MTGEIATLSAILLVALILFSLGSLFAIYEGIKKLQHPHELDKPIIAVGILGVAVALEAFSFRTAVVESRPLKGSQSWWSFIRTAKVPELPVLLLEDSGALVGLMLALGGVGMALITDDPVWDAYATLAIGALLAVIAVILIIEMRSLLLGEAASPEATVRLRGAIESSPSVRRLIHVRTMHVGPEELLVAAKIEFDASLDFAGVSNAIDETEARIRSLDPTATLIYLEPAIHDPSRS